LLDHGLHFTITQSPVHHIGIEDKSSRKELEAIVQAYRCAVKAGELCLSEHLTVPDSDWKPLTLTEHEHIALAEILAAKVATYEEICRGYPEVNDALTELLEELQLEYLLLRCNLVRMRTISPAAAHATFSHCDNGASTLPKIG
jgi:hypothetical protein